jgi:hypothetical protein
VLPTNLTPPRRRRARRFPKTINERPFYLAEYVKLFFGVVGDEITKARPARARPCFIGSDGLRPTPLLLPCGGAALSW